MQIEGCPARHYQGAQISSYASAVAVTAERLDICDAVAPSERNHLDVVFRWAASRHLVVRQTASDAAAEYASQNIPFTLLVRALGFGRLHAFVAPQHSSELCLRRAPIAFVGLNHAVIPSACM